MTLSVLAPLPLLAGGLAPSDESLRASLMRMWLEGRTLRTRRAYGQDLQDFARFLGAPSIDAAAQQLLHRPAGEANALALAYRIQLQQRGMAAATINRRLAALRSLVQLARTLGLVPWRLEVEGLDAVPFRDTRGPGRDGFCRMLAILEAGPTTPQALRDRAILRLLFDRALRRGEVASLDLADLDLEGGTLLVLGKGRSEREPLSLPPETCAALAAWIHVRGALPGPLFLNADRAGKGADRRLSDRSIARIIARIGAAAGLQVRPHGLRHAAITEALERTNGNVRAVQRFSRHRDVRTVQKYDDNREDLGGEIARLVARGA